MSGELRRRLGRGSYRSVRQALPGAGNANTKPTFSGAAANYATVWDGRANFSGTFQDGQSNTILFAEKYSRCDGTGSPGGTWWMRGVFHGVQSFSAGNAGGDDSYPGDRLSAVFGGGWGQDGVRWLQGTSSKFQVRPANALSKAPSGLCDRRLASTPHDNMNVGLADGSVRTVSAGISPLTWAAALTPAGGETLGSDW